MTRAAARAGDSVSAADVLRDLLWAVNQLPTVPGDYTEVVGPSGRGPFVSLPAIREAIDARLAAQPEPSAADGLVPNEWGAPICAECGGGPDVGHLADCREATR